MYSGLPGCLKVSSNPKPSLCKGGWHGVAVTGGLLIIQGFLTIPQSLRDSSLYTKEPEQVRYIKILRTLQTRICRAILKKVQRSLVSSSLYFLNLYKPHIELSEPIVELYEICYCLRCGHKLTVPRLGFICCQKFCQFILSDEIKKR